MSASSSGITSDEVTYKEPCIVLVTCFSTSKMHDYSTRAPQRRHSSAYHVNIAQSIGGRTST